MASAGLAASAWAAERAGVASAGPTTRVTFDGRAFHATQNQVVELKSFSFARSRTQLVSWSEVNGGVVTNHWAVALDGQAPRIVSSSENLVRLGYATFDPASRVAPVPAELAAPAGSELALVQYVATPLAEMQEQVRALGGVIERSLTDHAQVVRLPAGARAAVAALPWVRWVGEFHPAFKASAEVRDLVLGRGPLAELDAGGAAPVRFSIEVMRAEGQREAVGTAIKAMGGVVEADDGPGSRRLEASLTRAQLAQVLAMDEVAAVDPWGPPGTDTTNARAIGGITSIISPAGFNGQGVRGQVQDSEVQTTHPAWNGQLPLINGPVSAQGTHGTACYGINFSTGAGGFASTTGMLPQREQGVFAYYGSLGSDPRLGRTQRAVDPAGQFRVVYESNSWGDAQTTTYTTVSASMDDIILQTRLLVLNSQSNTGNRNSRPQAWAKNVTAIGGITHQGTLSRTDDTRTGTSIGPAQDNRVKPDLGHFYDATTATWPTNSTTTFSGTSNATPISAGYSGVFMQMWHEGVWPGFGGGSSVFASRPAFTTAKAALAASAFRYTWGGAGANANINRTVQGWGMIDLGKLYNLRTRTFVVNETDTLTTGAVRSYPLTVAAGEPELLVSMSYADVQGTVGAAQARVNNLSLRVTSPSGDVYWGNFGLSGTVASPALGSNWSPTGGTENTIDTTENVFVQNPAAGVWTVEVLGSEVVADTVPSQAGTQSAFGLWVLGAVSTPSCYANCDGSTALPVLNALDFSCFLNRYRAGESYANCDGSTAQPVLNALDFSCFLSRYQQGCN